MRFFVHGLGDAPWQPERSAELAILSPFCDDAALASLAARTKSPLALISRADELDQLSAATRARFAKVLVLDEMAETEDGEDTSGETERLRGLHAKAYLQHVGSDLHLVMGSANATGPGLLDGRNVELLVELVGSAVKVGGIAKLLEPDGFGAILQEYKEPDAPTAIESSARAAEDRLSAAREQLVSSGLLVVCDAAPEPGNDSWRLRLVSRAAITLEGISELRAWPVTLTDDRATPIPLEGRPFDESLGTLALVSITGFVAFELATPIEGAAKDLRTRFVLNLPIENLPEGRETAVVRTVISNQEGFLRYLALLLADLEDDPISTSEQTSIDWGRWLGQGSGEDLALLEPLVRALARDPERLEDVRRVVERIRAGDGAGEEVIPAEFLELWASFEAALEVGR